MSASTQYEEEEPDSSLAGPADGFATAAGKRILIVEDEAPVAQYLTELLSEYRCIVCGTAVTGRQAVDLAIASRPDLALIDIGLKGGMDGIRTAIEIKSAMQIATIFLSGSVDPIARERARSVGPIDFIQKPFLPERLEQVLRKAFDQP